MTVVVIIIQKKTKNKFNYNQKSLPYSEVSHFGLKIYKSTKLKTLKQKEPVALIILYASLTRMR
jgi:hypothetical protein